MWAQFWKRVKKGTLLTKEFWEGFEKNVTFECSLFPWTAGVVSDTEGKEDDLVVLFSKVNQINTVFLLSGL